MSVAGFPSQGMRPTKHSRQPHGAPAHAGFRHAIIRAAPHQQGKPGSCSRLGMERLPRLHIERDAFLQARQATVDAFRRLSNVPPVTRVIQSVL